jgi:hypothetical protein
VIRAHLVEVGTKERPAAHALLEVEIENGQKCYGVADERGCVAVLFPYPSLKGSLVGSPPRGPYVTDYNQQQWDVTIRAYYAPDLLIDIPSGSKIPEFRKILHQRNRPRARILPRWPGSPLILVNEWPKRLRFGQELVLRTEGLSKAELWISTGT